MYLPGTTSVVRCSRRQYIQTNLQLPFDAAPVALHPLCAERVAPGVTCCSAHKTLACSRHSLRLTGTEAISDETFILGPVSSISLKLHID